MENKGDILLEKVDELIEQDRFNKRLLIDIHTSMILNEKIKESNRRFFFVTAGPASLITFSGIIIWKYSGENKKIYIGCFVILLVTFLLVQIISIIKTRKYNKVLATSKTFHFK